MESCTIDQYWDHPFIHTLCMNYWISTEVKHYCYQRFQHLRWFHRDHFKINTNFGFIFTISILFLCTLQELVNKLLDDINDSIAYHFFMQCKIGRNIHQWLNHVFYHAIRVVECFDIVSDHDLIWLSLFSALHNLLYFFFELLFFLESWLFVGANVILFFDDVHH